MTVIGTISTSLSLNGEDVDVEWRIDSFISLLEEQGVYYYSPDFSFGGETWYMMIWPNGRNKHNSSAHVNLHLWNRSFGSSIIQEFSLSIKALNGEKYHEEHCTRVFGGLGRWHELICFILRSELLKRRSELVPNGVLTVVCTMKNTRSAESASNTASAEYYYSTSSEPESDPDSDECCPATVDSESDPESAECCHCKVAFDAVNLSSHQRKCMHRPIKCPDCLEVVVLQKWLDVHECQNERPEAEDCVARSSIVLHENKIFQDFKEFYLKKEICDVIIKVKGQEFPAHRAILSARSPVFASTYRHNTKEKTTGIIDIEDCEPFSFSDFLCFLYCGDKDVISVENVFSLFTTGDKYSVQDLRAKCVEFMKENLSAKTFCDTITLALLHSEAELITLATDFFTKHSLEIAKTVKWQSFVSNNPIQSNELFIKALAAKNSNE